jgi:hypothetical protein
LIAAAKGKHRLQQRRTPRQVSDCVDRRKG